MGHMINRHFIDNGVPVINIVRRDEQMDELTQKYAGPNFHVLNSESPSFKNDLRKLAHDINATVVIECVAGPLVGVISDCLPKDSSIIVYG